ncbi:hypothetical protein BKA70DRAFT_679538 [Coprinopsis sp. MPI-PUGE-AT-0042]|nr:hypothetical protein BKA70DRAFT_679538 [Coprinopsis sp. MPI-PUGE-AT-0042]
MVSLDSHEGGSPAQMAHKYLQRAPHGDAFIIHITCEDRPEGHEGRVSERHTVAALLPILSPHIHQISKLFMLTRFATSLPPYVFLCPQSDDPSAPLQKLTLKAKESYSHEIVPLPSWPDSPAIQRIPQMSILDLSGSTFVSFCRAANRLQSPPNPHKGQILAVRSLYNGSCDASKVEELLERVGSTLHQG